jgi:methylamine---glutamate N-methyltransferase subunit C
VDVSKPLSAAAFPEPAVRERARHGVAAAFPDTATYGTTLYGADPTAQPADVLDTLRLVPPVFAPRRLGKLIDLGREPMFRDVDLDTMLGGFCSTLPLYLSAFGSTEAGGVDLGVAAGRQAGRLGIPMVIGESVVPIDGGPDSPPDQAAGRSLLARIEAYAQEVAPGCGGVVVQQPTDDTDAETWRLVYGDPSALPLLESGRLAFELKVGQGAKPGLGGMSVLDVAAADRLAATSARHVTHTVLGGDTVVRSGSPGTFTEEILRQQIGQIRGTFPRARVWVKLPPARDLLTAALVAWDAGADAVTLDGAESGTGWAPTAFLGQVGLPLAECLRRVGDQDSCLLVSGRMWEGARVAKSLALGATAAGLGRAALIAVDEDPDTGLVNLVDCLAVELRMLTSAMGKYHCSELGREDIWATTEMSTMDALAGVW